MNYTLMHKTRTVAELVIDDVSSAIIAVNRVSVPEHLPVGTVDQDGNVNRTALNDWWLNRAIPASRSGIREALATLSLTDSRLLLTRGFGLSLSDQYWVKPENSGLQWSDINFFEHEFSEDIGNILFGEPCSSQNLSFQSPDNTSDGALKKRWKIINGKRCLIKGGSNPFQQQPFNEVIAYKIAEHLGIPHVPYTLIWSNGLPYSVCGNFVTPDTELVSAWRLMKTLPRHQNKSVYLHFVNCCTQLGVNGIADFLDQMIVLDYLIANEDRHLNNFGLLRNADTLEWIGPAPIFDSGSSLGYDKLESQIIRQQNITCKPFADEHSKQLRLVRSFDWLDLGHLEGLGTVIRSVFWENGADEYISAARAAAIAGAVEDRALQLTKYINLHG